jgi:hypothetical protein
VFGIAGLFGLRLNSVYGLNALIMFAGLFTIGDSSAIVCAMDKVSPVGDLIVLSLSASARLGRKIGADVAALSVLCVVGDVAASGPVPTPREPLAIGLLPREKVDGRREVLDGGAEGGRSTLGRLVDWLL